MNDPYRLQRFLDAQQPVFDQVCRELSAGAKTSHWMWFIFPQLQALGRSGTARLYGLTGRAEARAYWQHPVLGARLKDCATRVLQVQGRSARQIFSTPDDLKLRSCMTLFGQVAPDEPVFAAVIQRYFRGQPDVLTLDLLDRDSGQPG